jgi:hypothetical protein
MANIYDQSDGQFSVAPPAAPLPGALARRARGRLGGQGHLGVLAKLHPDHPIFKKFPGLSSFIRTRAARPQMATGIVPPPGSATAPPPGSQTAPPDPAAPAGSTTVAPPGASPYPWMQLPTDLSGLNQWGPTPQPQNAADPRAALQGRGAGLRQQLLQQMQQHGPNAQPLTSKFALNHHLASVAKQRMPGRRPILPQRRPLNRPY